MPDSDTHKIQRLFQAARIRPTTPTQLWHWIRDQYGLALPYKRVCRGHNAPFDYVVMSFFDEDDRKGWSPKEQQQYQVSDEMLIQACRGGAKTECGSVLSHLDCVFHDGASPMAVRILGGSEDQSLKMYQYFEDKCGLDQFKPLLASSPKRRETAWQNGASVSILVQSTKSVRGPRVQVLRNDEIDEFDEEVWRALNFVTFEAKGGKPSRWECLSTWHRPVGIFQKTVAAYRERGIPVLCWCLMEVIEKCGPDYECTDCDLVEWCEGRAKQKPENSGYMTVREARKQIRRSPTKEDVESELFCMRPRSGSLVYPNFDRVRNNSDLTRCPDLPLYGVIDFGWEEFACLWFHRTAQDELVFVDEYISRRQGNAVRAKEITQRDRDSRSRVVEWYGDPAGKARSAQTTRSDIEQFSTHGIPIIGIMPIDGLLGEVRSFREAIGGIGEPPRVFVNVRKCPHLTECLENYYKDETSELPKDRQPWEHACDAARYAWRAQGQVSGMEIGFGRSPLGDM